jgi:hypothetical protein
MKIEAGYWESCNEAQIRYPFAIVADYLVGNISVEVPSADVIVRLYTHGLKVQSQLTRLSESHYLVPKLEKWLDS